MRTVHKRAWGWVVVGLGVLVGCTTTSGFRLPGPPPCQAVATWSNQITYAADPVHGGQLVPGLVGRLYLFGPEIGHPLTGDGTIVVDLFDDTPRTGAPAPVQLEQWRFDPASAKKLLKPDRIGLGYTLFLHWGTYRPDIKQVHLKVRYETDHGPPLFAPSASITLSHGTPPPGTPAPTAGPAVRGTVAAHGTRTR